MRSGISPQKSRRSSHNKAKYARQFFRTAANKARRIRKDEARKKS